LATESVFAKRYQRLDDATHFLRFRQRCTDRFVLDQRQSAKVAEETRSDVPPFGLD
jgi:hypothetical protein